MHVCVHVGVMPLVSLVLVLIGPLPKFFVEGAGFFLGTGFSTLNVQSIFCKEIG